MPVIIQDHVLQALKTKILQDLVLSVDNQSITHKFLRDQHRTDIIITEVGMERYNSKIIEQQIELQEEVANYKISKINEVLQLYLDKMQVANSLYKIDMMSLKRFINQAPMLFLQDLFINDKIQKLMQQYGLLVNTVSDEFSISIELNPNGEVEINAQAIINSIKVIPLEQNAIYKKLGLDAYKGLNFTAPENMLDKIFEITIKINPDQSFNITNVQIPDLNLYEIAASKVYSKKFSFEDYTKILEVAKSQSSIAKSTEISEQAASANRTLTTLWQWTQFTASKSYSVVSDVWEKAKNAFKNK